MEASSAIQEINEYSQTIRGGLETQQLVFRVLTAVLREAMVLDAQYPATVRSAAVEHPPIEWRQAHQPFGIEWDIVLQMSVGPAIETLETITENRETHVRPMSEFSDSEPNLPAKMELFLQLVAQYVDLKTFAGM